VAFAFTKSDIKRRDDLISEVRLKGADLENAITGFNEGLEQLRGPVTDALAAYNEALGAVGSFAEDLHREQQEEFESKSEKWQETERGQEVSNWIDGIEGLTFYDVEMDIPEDIEVDLADADDALTEFEDMETTI